MCKERKKLCCRFCGGNLFSEPLIEYENMPAVAQKLPGLCNLDEDNGINLSVFQCQDCGLVQLLNEPVPYYREVIRSGGFSPEMKKWRKKQFKEFVKKYSLENKKILEVGCGKGEYLEVLNQTGVKACGIEYAKESVKYCLQNNLSVKKDFIDNNDHNIEGGPFDGFIMLQFLEHMPSPLKILKGLANNLNKEAVGIIEVPNFDMVIKQNMFSEFMRDHLYYFTKNTLRQVLEISGFEVLEIKELWYNYIISAVVRKRNKINVVGFCEAQEDLKNQIFNFVNKFKDKKIAVWGAGHQAFAVISLMNLTNDINYIVDSAIFKQGKFSPVTHVPIVSPEMLKKKPVDAIIVMAGSYSKEVVSTIQQKFGNRIKISVLDGGNLLEEL